MKLTLLPQVNTMLLLSYAVNTELALLPPPPPQLTPCYFEVNALVSLRHDLELQLTCYNASEDKDKQTSTCNWPPDVTIGINDHTLPVDKVSTWDITWGKLQSLREHVRYKVACTGNLSPIKHFVNKVT